MTGTWKIADNDPCRLPERVATGFSIVTADLTGAGYIPVLYCGEQLVHGTNYMLICKQYLSTAQSEQHMVSMILHEPLPSDADRSWKLISIDVIC